MIIEVYTSPEAVENFKNYKRVFVYGYPIAASRFKMLIDLTKVKVTDPTDHGIYIQRYSPSEKTNLN